MTAHPKIRVSHLGVTKDGGSRFLARLRGSKAFYEENDSTIWISWMETPPKQQNKGQAKALITFLKSLGKSLRPGSFSPSGKPLEKYFESSTPSNQP